MQANILNLEGPKSKKDRRMILRQKKKEKEKEKLVKVRKEKKKNC